MMHSKLIIRTCSKKIFVRGETLKNHINEISIDFFFFQVLIKMLFYEGFTAKSILLKN